MSAQQRKEKIMLLANNRQASSNTNPPVAILTKTWAIRIPTEKHEHFVICATKR
jgi:hypothetical protein